MLWPLALFSILWVDLVRILSFNWEVREQYSYGWFVPPFAAYLFARRWWDRPAPAPQTSPPWLMTSIGTTLVALVPLRVVLEINADWPLVAWLYTAMVIAITLHAVFLAGGWKWVRHFTFPVAFILVALVWPYRIEKGLTQNLMQYAASITVELLGILGLPALQRGNLIEVATGVVGVDEACSGIRSFQSTLMAGLLMGELYRFRLRPRAAMVILGLIMAFAFNIVRTLFLSWQASTNGVSSIEKWHDSAGLTILVACFFALWLLAGFLKRRGFTTHAASAENGEGATTHAIGRLTRPYLAVAGCVAVGALGATETWYRAHEIKDEGQFLWTAVMPTNKTEFAQIELAPRTAQLINANIMECGRWAGPDGTEWSMYFFRWKPSSIYSVLQARIHRPDRCLPASGLQQVADDGVRLFETAGIPIPFRRYTFEGEGGRYFVFFCLWEDGSRSQSGLQASNQEGRLQSVLAGRRKLGQQTLEFVLKGCDSQDAADNLLRSTLSDLVAMQHKPRG